jgi:hypothetical protein
LIDTVLIDNDPVRETDFFANKRFRIVDGFYDAQISFPSCLRSLMSAKR